MGEFSSVGPVVMSGKSSVTNSLGANDPEVGTIKRFEDGCLYEWIYNDGNTELYPARGCVLNAGSGITGASVTGGTTTSVAIAYGVCRNATISTGYYGWVVKQGFTEVEMEANNSAVTGALIVLADDGEFAYKSNSTGYPAPAAGYLMESAASGASALAYVSVY